MTGQAYSSLVRFKTHTNSSTFPDSDMTALTNVYKDSIAGDIQMVRPDVWQIPFLDNLVESQREYAFPTGVLNNIVYVEVKFSDTGDFRFATPTQRLQFRESLQETIITNNYNNDVPFYFTRRNAIFLLSGSIDTTALGDTSITDAIKVVANIFPANFADSDWSGSTDLSVDPTTTSHGFPREFHELLARRVSIQYKEKNDVNLDPTEANYEEDLKDKMDQYSIAILDEQIQGSLPSGTETANDGFDL